MSEIETLWGCRVLSRTIRDGDQVIAPDALTEGKPYLEEIELARPEGRIESTFVIMRIVAGEKQYWGGDNPPIARTA